MKKEKWLKRRHRIVRNIAFSVLYPYAKFKYGITIEKFREQKRRQYLVLYNHQTAFDQFFVGMSIKETVYYLASEDLFSNGWVSKLIRFLVAPIPIKKQTTDVSAVKNCIRVAKEGGTIAIAPEGNRTYSGKTEYMNPAIAALAKKLKLPILLYRIEGGYGVHPRWSDVVRKGKMRAFVSKVIEPETYENLTNDELLEIIQTGLCVNEANAENSFFHPKRAEYLERAIYICPFCGLSSFESSNHIIECKRCKKQITYEENTELKGVGFRFPFRFVSEWYDYQKDYINELDLTLYNETPLYRDQAQISEVILYKSKNILRNSAQITLYGNRIVIDEGKDDMLVFGFDEVSAVTVLGRNKLNIYFDGKVYQLKSDKRFNALKYVHIFNGYTNISRGVLNGKFLGL